MLNYTIEAKEAFTIVGVSRAFHAPEAMREIPEFWDEYFKNGCGAVACGQFAYCYDETPEGNFRYAIGNFCERDFNGVYHIFNRPDRTEIPAGFELLTVPARTWMRVECLGPLPQSIQGMYPAIQKEWPAEWERVGGCELEEYGYCTCPEDSQKPDYQCFIWIPVRRKCGIVALREHPELLEKFVAYFAAKWGNEALYRDSMSAAISSQSALPQWFMAQTLEGEILGGAGLISNDFISRMDLSPWLCALFVEEKFRHQGLGGKLIEAVAECAQKLGFQELFCATDHIGYYEHFGFEYLAVGVHPWHDTSRIYCKKLLRETSVRARFNEVAEEYDVNRRKFIPCFDGFYAESSKLATAAMGAPERVLDLGAGTGILSMYWMQFCPAAEYVLTDIAEAMLEVARRRFAGCANVSFQVSDYAKELPDGEFDAVISALSIHHLEDADKAELFARIFAKLPSGGWFFNYDQFCLADGALNAAQDKLWVEAIYASGMPENELARWRERRKLDRECTVEAELAMLRQSGFEAVECIYRSGKFAVLAARKK